MGFPIFKPIAMTHFSQERAKWRENMNYVMHANEFHSEEYSAGNK